MIDLMVMGLAALQILVVIGFSLGWLENTRVWKLWEFLYSIRGSESILEGTKGTEEVH